MTAPSEAPAGPDARLALVSGADELWFTGAVGPLLAEVDAFLASVRPVLGGDRTRRAAIRAGHRP